MECVVKESMRPANTKYRHRMPSRFLLLIVSHDASTGKLLFQLPSAPALQIYGPRIAADVGYMIGPKVTITEEY